MKQIKDSKLKQTHSSLLLFVTFENRSEFQRKGRLKKGETASFKTWRESDDKIERNPKLSFVLQITTPILPIDVDKQSRGEMSDRQLELWFTLLALPGANNSTFQQFLQLSSTLVTCRCCLMSALPYHQCEMSYNLAYLLRTIITIKPIRPLCTLPSAKTQFSTTPTQFARVQAIKQWCKINVFQPRPDSYAICGHKMSPGGRCVIKPEIRERYWASLCLWTDVYVIFLDRTFSGLSCFCMHNQIKRSWFEVDVAIVIQSHGKVQTKTGPAVGSRLRKCENRKPYTLNMAGRDVGWRKPSSIKKSGKKTTILKPDWVHVNKCTVSTKRELPSYWLFCLSVCKEASS